MTAQVKIVKTAGFQKAYDKLTVEVQARADEVLRQFYENPRHPGLHFEKYYSALRTIRVDRKRWRIVMRDLGDSRYELVDIDRHEKIDRRY